MDESTFGLLHVPSENILAFFDSHEEAEVDRVEWPVPDEFEIVEFDDEEMPT